MIQVILAILLSLPAHYQDAETPLEREQRMAVVAEAIWEVSGYATCSDDWHQTWCRPIWPRTQRIELAALLIDLGWYESRFARHVQDGRCGPHECDAVKLGGLVYHRARSAWQVQWQPVIRAQWNEMTGSEPVPTFEAAYAAARVLSASRRRCGARGPWVAPTIAGYAGAQSCRWRGATDRAKKFWEIRGVLQRAFQAGAGPELRPPSVPALLSLQSAPAQLQ